MSFQWKHKFLLRNGWLRFGDTKRARKSSKSKSFASWYYKWDIIHVHPCVSCINYFCSNKGSKHFWLRFVIFSLLIKYMHLNLQGNTDHNIFLWTTSGCAISLCLLEVSFCGFIILFACSTLVAACGIILHFLIGLGYAVFVIMTVMMENHPTNVNVYLIVNIGLGFARFSIMVRSIALSWVWWLVPMK